MSFGGTILKYGPATCITRATKWTRAFSRRDRASRLCYSEAERFHIAAVEQRGSGRRNRRG